jgi:hypothetical protein
LITIPSSITKNRENGHEGPGGNQCLVVGPATRAAEHIGPGPGASVFDLPQPCSDDQADSPGNSPRCPRENPTSRDGGPARSFPRILPCLKRASLKSFPPSLSQREESVFRLCGTFSS